MSNIDTLRSASSFSFDSPAHFRIAEKAKAEAKVDKAKTKAEEQDKVIAELRARLDKTASAPSGKEGDGGEDVIPASVQCGR